MCQLLGQTCQLPWYGARAELRCSQDFKIGSQLGHGVIKKSAKGIFELLSYVWDFPPPFSRQNLTKIQCFLLRIPQLGFRLILMIFEDFWRFLMFFWSPEVAQHIFTMFLGLIFAVESIYGGFKAIRNLLRKLRTIAVLKISNFPKCVNFSQRRVRINPAYDCNINLKSRSDRIFR